MAVQQISAQESQQSLALRRGIDGISGVAAYMLQMQFVEQGIVGQPLFVRPIGKNYAVYSVQPDPHLFLPPNSRICDENQFSLERHIQREPPTADLLEGLWKPKRIPSETWDRAITQFTGNASLALNIKRHLLPLLDSIDGLFSDDQISRMVLQFCLDSNILLQPIRIADGFTYFFDQDQIYRRKPNTGQKKRRVRHLWYCMEIDMRIWKKASTKFQVGESLMDCIRRFLQTELVHKPPNITPLDRLVTRIGPISYERMFGNENPLTLDWIRVQVNLSHTAYPVWEEFQRMVEEHQQEITQMVVEKIQNDRKFQKYGVPFSRFKLSNLIFSRKYFLEYIFEFSDFDQ